MVAAGRTAGLVERHRGTGGPIVGTRDRLSVPGGAAAYPRQQAMAWSKSKLGLCDRRDGVG